MSTERAVGNDPEARLVLWRGICHSAELLSGSCSVFTSKKPLSEGKVNNLLPVPDVKTWQLMEALSLLVVLLKADKILAKDICNIFGKTGPLQFSENGADRYLWTQASIKGQKSLLGSRPDLLVTSDSKQPTHSNIIRIIECKCQKSIGAQVIRAEFGKAYDLKVTSYLILSFITPSLSAKEGCKNLGLDIEALGFDTDMREKLIANPENLVWHVANTVEVSKKEASLLRMLTSSTEQAKQKFLSVS